LPQTALSQKRGHVSGNDRVRDAQEVLDHCRISHRGRRRAFHKPERKARSRLASLRNEHESGPRGQDGSKAHMLVRRPVRRPASRKLAFRKPERKARSRLASLRNGHESGPRGQDGSKAHMLVHTPVRRPASHWQGRTRRRGKHQPGLCSG